MGETGSFAGPATETALVLLGACQTSDSTARASGNAPAVCRPARCSLEGVRTMQPCRPQVVNTGCPYIDGLICILTCSDDSSFVF